MSTSKDPVAEKSSFLCMYMSNHPDTLVAYVKYFGNVKEKVVSARMSGINTNGMNLSYKTSSAEKEKEKEVRVPFDPPLAGYDEVKPRLLGMTADAQESLGMTKAPQITSFHLNPTELPKSALPLSFLAYVLASPHYAPPITNLTSSSKNNQYWALGKYLYYGIGGTTMWVIAGTAFVIHVLEALYVGRLCARHRTGLGVGFLYVLSTFIFGFPVMLPLRARIQKARIDSIMKGN